MSHLKRTPSCSIYTNFNTPVSIDLSTPNLIKDKLPIYLMNMWVPNPIRDHINKALNK